MSTAPQDPAADRDALNSSDPQRATTATTSGRAPWQRALPWAGLLLAGVVLVAHATHFDFINDDAFISFRYADNLVRHGELTFNVGERVEGYTNFLWTMIIAAVLWLGGDPVPWSKGLGTLLALGTLGVTFQYTRWWTRHALDAQVAAARSPLWAAAAPLFLAMSSAFACWSQGGLETSLSTFLITLGLLRAHVELHTNARLPWSGAVFALAAMTRPDGLLIAGLVGVFRAFHSAITRRSLLPSREDWIWGGLLLGLYGPYWLWRTSYYGYPLPNTYYAKGGMVLWEPGLRYLGGFIKDCHVWALLPLAALPWRGAPRGAALPALVATVSVPLMLYYARVGGDFMALYRFYVPLLPAMAVVGQEGAASLVESLRHAGPYQGRRWTARVALAAALLLGAHGVHNWRLTERALEVGSDRGVDSIGWLKMFVGQTTAIGLYLRASYPPETSIATTAAGVIPYYSRLKTLDLLALNDVHTAHNVKARGRRPGHSKAAPEPYVLEWAPTLLIKHPRISDKRPRSSATEQRYWRQRGYKFVYVEVPDLQPPFWAYFERLEAP